MADSHGSTAGQVLSIWRYPVKSMRGEELIAAEVVQGGLVGDRVLALLDLETGKVASSKNPRRWPQLFGFQATYEKASQGQTSPAVRIAFPSGEEVRSDYPDIESRLSTVIGRRVRLVSPGAGAATTEGYWPDYEWLAKRDELFEFPFPPGTFYDGATVHLLTTATLEYLQARAPQSRFEPARFRPNFVIKTAAGSAGLIENQWFERILKLGEVQLRVERPCPRCVMTTLAQGNLAKDPEVLRVAVNENAGNVGAYASVVRGGQVRQGDIVELV